MNLTITADLIHDLTGYATKPGTDPGRVAIVLTPSGYDIETFQNGFSGPVVMSGHDVLSRADRGPDGRADVTDDLVELLLTPAGAVSYDVVSETGTYGHPGLDQEPVVVTATEQAVCTGLLGQSAAGEWSGAWWFDLTAARPVSSTRDRLTGELLSELWVTAAGRYVHHTRTPGPDGWESTWAWVSHSSAASHVYALASTPQDARERRHLADGPDLPDLVHAARLIGKATALIRTPGPDHALPAVVDAERTAHALCDLLRNAVQGDLKTRRTGALRVITDATGSTDRAAMAITATQPDHVRLSGLTITGMIG